MKSSLKVVVVCIIGAVEWFAFLFGESVSIDEQQTILLALRDMSAIIFAIMGAWIAVLHPAILKGLTKDNGTVISDSELPSSQHLITPMVYAAAAIVYVMGFGLVSPILEQTITSRNKVAVFHGISFALLTGFTLLLIYALLLAFYPYMLAKIRATKADVETRKKDAITGLTNKVSRDE